MPDGNVTLWRFLWEQLSRNGRKSNYTDIKPPQTYKSCKDRFGIRLESMSSLNESRGGPGGPEAMGKTISIIPQCGIIENVFRIQVEIEETHGALTQLRIAIGNIKR